ncbi:helix-turn-helix domain-containing protein [Wukongibacter baidiensis]|uniref:helix-turn-helix domain-containing protein n=1 Tax=Wukongibacter baidiensis TaxID=1723361 RepID=UPI003D7FB16A
MSFGKYLRSTRKKLMSQRELASKIGVGYPYISKIENGIEPPPSEEVLIRMSKTLEVGLDDLFIIAKKIPTDIQNLIIDNPEIYHLLRLIKNRSISKNTLKEIETLIEDKENRYHSIFYNNKNVMLLINPETGEIVDANLAASTFYGYSLEEFKDKRITDINTLSKEEISNKMQKARMEERNHFRFKHVISQGKVKDVEVYSSPIILNGMEYLHSSIYEMTGDII